MLQLDQLNNIAKSHTDKGVVYHLPPDLIRFFYDNISLPAGKKQFRYPSVTTLISSVQDKSGLERWEQRVGKEKAEQIRRSAAQRGTSVHAFIEAYYKNQPYPVLTKDELEYIKHIFPIFKQMKLIFSEQKIFWVSESYPLCGYAGTIDACVAADLSRIIDCQTKLPVGDGVHNLVADIKTWTKPKPEKYLVSYFLQLAAYAGGLNFLSKNLYQVNKGLIVASTTQDVFLYYLSPELMKFYWNKWVEVLNAYFFQQPFNWNQFVEEALEYPSHTVNFQTGDE